MRTNGEGVVRKGEVGGYVDDVEGTFGVGDNVVAKVMEVGELFLLVLLVLKLQLGV